MKRQLTRQQNETYFSVQVPRDRSGYEVVSRIVCAGTVETTIAGGNRKKGDVVVEIVGRSGEIELVTYKTGSNRSPIWPKLKKLAHPGGIAHFMSKWGAIHHMLWMQPKHIAPLDALLPLIGGLRHLAACVESNDVNGFLGALKDQTIFHGTLKLEADVHGRRLLGEASSLAQFLVLEMWMDFGGDRPSRGGIKTCAWCSQPFRAGGRRKSTALRVDAAYCSKSCRNTASRARVNNRTSKPT